jgi:hypothetical protein
VVSYFSMIILLQNSCVGGPLPMMVIQLLLVTDDLNSLTKGQRIINVS